MKYIMQKSSGKDFTFELNKVFACQPQKGSRAAKC